MPSSWIDSLRDTLQAELTGMLPAVKDVWKEVSSTPIPPSPMEEVNAFLNLPQEQVAQLAQQLGPENFSLFVQENLQKVSEVFDPNTANKMAPYYLQHIPTDPTVQYGLDNTPSLDLESVIDRALEEQLAEDTN